jgi:hypothetical protein
MRIKFPVSEQLLMEITKPKPVAIADDAGKSAKCVCAVQFLLCFLFCGVLCCALRCGVLL